jgi:hypothetical protein
MGIAARPDFVQGLKNNLGNGLLASRRGYDQAAANSRQQAGKRDFSAHCEEIAYSGISYSARNTETAGRTERF